MASRFLRLVSVFAAVVASGLAAQAAGAKNLDIYWVDVEGGAATLMVSPSGESLLYDSGWEVGDRDAAEPLGNEAPRQMRAPALRPPQYDQADRRDHGEIQQRRGAERHARARR